MDLALHPPPHDVERVRARLRHHGRQGAAKHTLEGGRSLSAVEIVFAELGRRGKASLTCREESNTIQEIPE